jgi:hypothetical protein
LEKSLIFFDKGYNGIRIAGAFLPPFAGNHILVAYGIYTPANPGTPPAADLFRYIPHVVE